MREGVTHTGKIVRVHDIVCFPPFHVLQRLAYVLSDLPVDAYGLAARRHDGDQAGNAVHD